MPALPDPRDLLELLQQQAATITALPNTLAKLNESADRLEEIAERMNSALDAFDDVTRRTDRMVGRAEEQMDQAAPVFDRVTEAADQMAGTTKELVERAPRLAGTVESMTARASRMLEAAEGPLQEALPVVREVTQAVDPAALRRLPEMLRRLDEQVLAADVVELLGRLPEMARRMEQQLTPAGDRLPDTIDDVHAIRVSMDRMLDLMDDLQTRVSGLPGSRLLKRRGAQEQDDDEAG